MPHPRLARKSVALGLFKFYQMKVVLRPASGG
jgi:hypothetical protein